MKITILQGAFFPVPPIKGGAVEKIWYRIGQQFAELGNEVVHISRTFPDLKENEQVNGVTYLRIPGYDTPSSLVLLKWLDFRYSVRALKYISRETDVIVTNTFWAPFLLKGKQGKKVYASVERAPKGQMRFYRHVGVLRGCSPAICNAIKREIPISSHHLVSYVPNPVPFDVKPTNVEREKIILFVGRLHPEKGVHILIEAFSKLKKEIANEWTLLIVGPSEVKYGGGGDSYLRRILRLSENINVKFAGPVYEEQELINYYSKASIFCYPAQEGSGDAAPVAPREAMSYGCVPIVSKLECFNDFIINGQNGISFDHTSESQSLFLADALTKLINDKAVLHKMSLEGKLIYNNFSVQVIAKRFLKDFERILSQQ